VPLPSDEEKKSWFDSPETRRGKMVGIVSVVKPVHRVEREVAVAEAPALHRVVWYKDPGLRKLYGMAIALFFASATTGYDG
jgi:hypothetical protein